MTHSTARKCEQERLAPAAHECADWDSCPNPAHREPAPEVGLTEAEMETLHSPSLCDCDELLHCRTLAATYLDVARIKADAIQQERAAWVAKIEALASGIDGVWNQRLRALLSSDATEALDAVKAEAAITLSVDAARAVLRAVEDDPDRSKWAHHQHLRTEAIAAFTDYLARLNDGSGS